MISEYVISDVSLLWRVVFDTLFQFVYSDTQWSCWPISTSVVGKENEETSGCIHYLDRLAGETRQSQRCEDSAAVSQCSQPAEHKVSVVVSCKSQQWLLTAKM